VGGLRLFEDELAGKINDWRLMVGFARYTREQLAITSIDFIGRNA
jgi:hypothetical protein